MNYALIGFMGCGKTTVGKTFASKIGYDFIDCDSEIEKSENMSISRIFAEYGEDYFRTLEHNFIKNLNVVRTVIATGGGIVKKRANIDILKENCIIIYLKASPQKIYCNISHDNTRPLLDVPDKLKKINGLIKEREPMYASSADIILNADFPTDELVNELIKMQCLTNNI